MARTAVAGLSSCPPWHGAHGAHGVYGVYGIQGHYWHTGRNAPQTDGGGAAARSECVPCVHCVHCVHGMGHLASCGTSWPRPRASCTSPSGRGRWRGGGLKPTRIGTSRGSWTKLTAWHHQLPCSMFHSRRSDGKNRNKCSPFLRVYYFPCRIMSCDEFWDWQQ